MLRRAVLIAVLACSCGKSAPHVTKVENGMQLTFSSPTGGDIDATATIVRRRLELANIPAVVTTKDGLLVVDLQSPRDTEAFAHARDLIAITARLDIRQLDEKSAWLEALVARVPPTAEVSSEIDQWMDNAGMEQHTARFLFAKDHDEQVDPDRAKAIGCYRRADADGGKVTCTITGRRAIEDYLTAAAAVAPANKVPDDREVLFEALDRNTWRTHLALKQSPVPLDQVTATAAGESEVAITLPPAAKAAFANLTRDAAGHKLAFLVDGRVVAAPIISGSITAGTFTLVNVKEPALLASALRGGSLPAPLREETELMIKNGKVVPPESP